ncbi:MAG: adenylate/guanylate cyclase domain-containing protein [Parasphingopyxis sp.]|uniref:adenylate/guanylate cyclase domain-containing protein n=1 Tax=Parasphingopyxis sp. TaxID=1920299 RepID=UPI00262D6419|nr:adenylate/guanylate cyclase domain-containing protein [uncultured Parasphingopyxis sp.]
MATVAPDLPASNPRERSQSGLRSRLRRLYSDVKLGRLLATVFFVVAALLIARYSWSLPFMQDVERVLYDVRATYAMERVEEDERISIVVYDSDTLFNTGIRSPVDREIMAQALTNLDAMNPRAIAIDILYDMPTENDEMLVEALRGMETPTHVGYLTLEHNPNELEAQHEEFLGEFFDRINTERVGPTSVRLLTDTDDVIRSWPDQPDGLPPLMANSLAPGHDEWRDYRGSIELRRPLYQDGVLFTQLPIDFFADPMLAESFRPFIEGRYIFIGSDLPDVDRFQTPVSRITGGTVHGVAIHALLMAQMLDGNMYTPVPPVMLWLIALVVVLAAAATSLSEVKLWRMGLLILVQFAIFALLPWYLHTQFIDSQDMPVMGWLVGWLIAFIAVGSAARSIGAEKREYVTGALGKYLPGDVADQLLADPDMLALHGEKRPIYALFTDLEGFTKLSHAIEPEMVAQLLNSYLDLLVEQVLEHGGTLDKFVGDAVVAFWGAPITRPDDADRAAKCAVAMWEASEKWRQEAPEGVPKIGRTRVGLHYGEAVVGNFGGVERIQYTALGDAMNTAARLEGANKYLDTVILASGEAVANVKEVPFRPVGRVTLSGRSTPVEIFEPVLPVTAGSAEQIDTLYRQFEEGDLKARDALAALARENEADTALANFVERLKAIKPGESYVFENK